MKINLQPWQIVFIILPLWLLVGITENLLLSFFVALLGSILILLWIINYIKIHHQSVPLLRLSGVSLLAMVTLGWLFAATMTFFSYGKSFRLVLQEEVGVTVSGYAFAIVYTILFCAALDLLGHATIIRTSEISLKTKLKRLSSYSQKNIFSILLALNLFQLALVFSGVYAYRGYNVEGYGKGVLAWYIPYIGMMSWFHVSVNSLYLSTITKYMGDKFKVLLISISIFFVQIILLSTGRRDFVLGIVVHFIWFIFFTGRIPKLRGKHLLALSVILPAIMTFLLLFNFMRSSKFIYRNAQTESFFVLIIEGYKQYTGNSELQDQERLRSGRNLATRPLVLHPLAKAQALSLEKKHFLWGENLRNSLIWVVPRNLFPAKEKFPVQEDLLYPNFPIGDKDTADSPYLSAYIDFWWFGLLTYPFVLGLIWLIVLKISLHRLISPIFSLLYVAVCVPLFILAIGESSLITWFSSLRNILITFPVIVLLKPFMQSKRM